jgi:23S rRNA (uracil1939-C5)-methyltransferase
MAFGGAGIGHVDGKVCFVPFTAVGDKARVRIRSERKSYVEGNIIEILEPSPLRTIPRCPVFGTCGGCDWQHIEYAAQLKAKENIFAEILWRTARVEGERIAPIAGAPDCYGYRSRIQLKVRFAKGENHIGFFMAGSHYVVDIPGLCAISSEPVNRTYGELCEILKKFTEPDKIPQIDVSSGDDGVIILIFHYIGEKRSEIIDFLRENGNRLHHVGGVFLQSGRKNTIEKVYGLEAIHYTIPESVFNGLASMRLQTSRGGFSQVNYRQNDVLLETVLQWVRPCGKERVLDLYCGNGNFSLPLARYANHVIGFEEYEQSIKDAICNRDGNRLANAGFEAVDSVEGVRKLIDAGERFDVVILDPPRTGAAEVVKLIPFLRPEKIIYISCDPPTLSRDMSHLRKMRYDVVKSLPVDMFPQTYHIESVTLVEKGS